MFKMLKFLSAHGKVSVLQGNKIMVLCEYTYRDGGQAVNTGEMWETIPATWGAVRAWLGY